LSGCINHEVSTQNRGTGLAGSTNFDDQELIDEIIESDMNADLTRICTATIGHRIRKVQLNEEYYYYYNSGT